MDIDDDLGDELAALMPSTLDYDKEAQKQQRKKQAMHSSLAKMMYGGGDDENPLPQSRQLMEYIITDFIAEFCIDAQNLAEQSGRNRDKVKVEDFLFLIRKFLKEFCSL